MENLLEKGSHVFLKIKSRSSPYLGGFFFFENEKEISGQFGEISFKRELNVACLSAPNVCLDGQSKRRPVPKASHCIRTSDVKLAISFS